MKNYRWSLINSFFGIGFNTIFGIILGNLLLPDIIGYYVTILMVVNYSITLLYMNIESTVVQRLADNTYKLKKNAYYTTTLLIYIFISFIIAIIYYSFDSFIYNLFNLELSLDIYYVIIPLIFFMILRRIMINILKSHLLIKRMSIANIFAAVCQIITVIPLILLNYELNAIIISFYTANIISILIMYMEIRKHFKFEIKSVNLELIKDILRFSLLIHMGTVAVFLDNNIDIYFVNLYLEPSQLALYNYSIKIALLFTIIGLSFSNVTFSKMTYHASIKDEDYVNLLYNKMTHIVMFILSICALVLLLNKDFFITIILPDSYLEMKNILLILVIGILPFAAWSSVGTLLTSLKKPGIGAIANWIALTVNICLNIYLIPTYGLIGVAFATSISFLLRVVLIVIVTLKITFVKVKYLRIFAMYCLFIAIVYIDIIYPLTIILQALVILTYSLFSYLFLFNHEIRQELKISLKKMLFIKIKKEPLINEK